MWRAFVYILSSHQDQRFTTGPVRRLPVKDWIACLEKTCPSAANIYFQVVFLKWNWSRKYALETHKKFNFITSRGQFTGKTWHKIFLKQFLADFKIIRDSIIMITVSPICQMFIKKVKKQRARKFDRISWNSNHQSPCEINCDLPESILGDLD